MKVVISSLMHGRHKTTAFCLQKNIEAGIGHYSYAYTNDEDRDFLLSESVFSHIQMFNDISAKAQASLFQAYEHNPDAVMLMGCDDYIDQATFGIIVRMLQSHDYIAFKDCIFDDGGKLYRWPGYPRSHERYGEPAGAGRVVRRDLLDAIDWQVFAPTGMHRTDYDSHQRLMSTAKHPAFIGMNSGARLVDVKDSASMTKVGAFNYLKPIY